MHTGYKDTSVPIVKSTYIIKQLLLKILAFYLAKKAKSVNS